uniref:ATP synthase subunit g, mitochondrial n=1 Tax=Strongyloides venezuelensis TaxID=75913 RepID=A0A0K0FZV0_STRVS
MATRKMNMFEKMANLVGVLYRHQQRQFPRRYDLLTKVFKKELAPPNAADIPAIKRDWATLLKALETRQYRNLTVKEFLVYSAVGMEILFWFFVGEMIGRRNVCGYIVPADFVSKETRKMAKNQVVEDKNNF